jgi:NAD(P)-dependent dehydrogenase (short-subunit alcohol dehydrogenase family)
MSEPDERRELLGTKLFDLTGKVAVVTGGSRGFGRVFAVSLAAAGADVVVTARSEGDLQVTRDEVRALGRRSELFVADVTIEDEVEALMAFTVATFGRIDVLVNNAGLNVRKPAVDYPLADFERVLATNLKGYFLCARAAGRHMLRQRSGSVINVSSILGSVALAGQAGYASSKGAINQLTKVLAIEWAPENVRVNALAPTYFLTELTKPLYDDPERRAFITGRTPMGRWGEPHELAGSIVFLASDASSFITGHTLLVDGGWTAW